MHTSTSSVRFTAGLSVQWAMENGADLRGADLCGANLRGTDLGGANLSDADLLGADLRGTDLTDTDLGGADLGGANLGAADLRGAYLGGANLKGAYLNGAYLNGAYLGCAGIVDGGQRTDGYRFVGWVNDDVLQIRAGCRNYTITEAKAHWSSTDYRNEKIGAETMLILDHIEQTAVLRGLIGEDK